MPKSSIFIILIIFLKISLRIHEENTKDNNNRVVSLYLIDIRDVICEEVNFFGL